MERRKLEALQDVQKEAEDQGQIRLKFLYWQSDFMSKPNYQAPKMANVILRESNKEMKIISKAVSKKMREIVKTMPQHPITRLVDIGDPALAMSWEQGTEKLEDEEYRNEISGRRYRHLE